MNVTINWQTIITVASVITAVVLIIKSFRKVNSYAEKPNKNEEAIKELSTRLDKESEKNEALAKGMQALLRASMVKDFNHYTAKNYAPIYAKENFQNVYNVYHSLGANGVMDSLYETFMALPTEDNNAKEEN